MNAPDLKRGVAQDAAVQSRVEATIRADVRALSAYTTTQAEGMIKLDAMENPFPLPAALRAKIAAATANVPINRYPDGAGTAVKRALRAALRLPDAAGLILGNGSDELILMLTLAVAAPGAAIIAPDPSFVMYRLNAIHAKARYVPVDLRADFALDLKRMLSAIEREKPALVWLAYPNNPTGNAFARSDIEAILQAAPGLCVVDEAYYAFATDSFLPRVLDHPNLVVLRTLSKVGMAGLRLGYAVAHTRWIAEIEKVRAPYNVNALTQAVAPILLDESALLGEQAAVIRGERARLSRALAAIRGVRVFPTETNFVLTRVPDAPLCSDALRDAGILVKNLHGWHPLLDHCLRITVGTPAENDRLLSALERFA